ncbi:XTP/dITP diphosphatase [Dehalogenimonas sp. THU2]|uniref:XTP/dITP diphosphatase n=1 Tax=Dehalogenimonas sp. THU2 TaxID=3151121 RepID=UPI003218C48C
MTRPQLLLATNNPGKLREYTELLSTCGYELVTPGQRGIELEVAETGTTFAENAALKARALAAASGMLTLADDSGLEVDALGGAPGVLSARYAGEGAGDAERNALLLKILWEVPVEKRTARFRCVIAIAVPDGGLRFAEGVVEGRIAFEPHGSNGFGYDPVFSLPELGKTMAEIAPDEKNRLSHRARAAAAACKILKDR